MWVAVLCGYPAGAPDGLSVRGRLARAGDRVGGQDELERVRLRHHRREPLVRRCHAAGVSGPVDGGLEFGGRGQRAHGCGRNRFGHRHGRIFARAGGAVWASVVSGDLGQRGCFREFSAGPCVRYARLAAAPLGRFALGGSEPSSQHRLAGGVAGSSGGRGSGRLAGSG